MTISPLAKKLRLHTAKRALLLNAPAGYLAMLGELPKDLSVETEAAGTYDFVHVFAKNRAELERHIDQALAALAYDKLLWISYPKGGSGVETDLNRDKIWEAMQDKGIRPVTQVSIDKVWSAMRFRPAEAVGI